MLILNSYYLLDPQNILSCINIEQYEYNTYTKY